MDNVIIVRDIVDLEHMLLDGSAKPACLSLSLLEKITKGFSNDQQVGSGAFGVVYMGKVGKGMIAVKKLSKTFGVHENKFCKELECLMMTKHKNIVRFLGYCSDTQGMAANYEGKFVIAEQRNWLLCFEYLQKGSLHNYIDDASRGLEWRQRYNIIKGTCEGLLHLHEKRILHLDLKPGNILLDDHMVPKIADFGLSRCLDKEQTRISTLNTWGSLGYLAPESCGGKFTFASDIYSLGVIIVEIITGEKGYPEGDDVVETWMNRLEGSDQWEIQLEQVRVCIMIGTKCMDSDPKKRPLVSHINDMLDKLPRTIEIGISSSSVEQQVSFLNEQYYEEKIAKISSECLEKDIKERAETEELVESVGTPREDHWQQGREEVPDDQWSLWGSKATKQDIISQGSSISSSNSGLLYKLNNLDIFNKKARTNHVRHGGHSLAKIKHVKVFERGQFKPILKDMNLIGIGPSIEIYLGILDRVPVVVKKCISGSMQENGRFADEVIVQSQFIHKNIVRLIGYCMEVDNPLVVYEYFSRGSLHDILHSNNRVRLNLAVRLSIAAESAGAIAYMHSTTTKLVHGDFNSANILLDDHFVPKISYFGISRMIARDPEHTALNNLDMTYMDPVYVQTGRLTEKCDVYSFAVVMLELLTRKKATHSDNNSLVSNFLENHRMGRKSTELFDKEIAVTRDLELLDSLAGIAVECLNLDTDLRPTMVNVAERLSMLNRSR